MNDFQIVREALESVIDTADWGTCQRALEALKVIEADHFTSADMASAAAQGFRDGVASVQQGELVAWVHKDDPRRVISAVTKNGADKDGGAIASTTKPYSIPAYAAPVAQPQAEHDLKDTRCGYCGYMTYQREHMNCIRSAAAQAEAVPTGWLNAPVGYAPTFLHQPQPPAPLTKQEALIAGWMPLFKATPQQAEAVPINYLVVQEFANKHRVSYNELCVMVREATAQKGGA